MMSNSRLCTFYCYVSKGGGSGSKREAGEEAGAGNGPEEAAVAEKPKVRRSQIACSAQQLQDLKTRADRDGSCFLYRVMDDADMRLISLLQEPASIANAHALICPCPYAKIALNDLSAEALSRYVFTTRSPAYAVYDALTRFRDEKVRCPVIVKIDIQKFPYSGKIADFSEGSKGDVKKFKTRNYVVLEGFIPADAIVGFLQIKSEKKEDWLKSTHQDGKDLAFSKWKTSSVSADTESELLQPCSDKEGELLRGLASALKQWEAGKKQDKEREFRKQLPAECMERMAIGRATQKDQRIVRWWKSNLPMLTVAVACKERNEYLLDSKLPHIISFPLPDKSALDTDLFLDIMITLTDAILWHYKGVSSTTEGFVFIHCTYGVSRSVALAVVALMRLKGISFQQAKEQVHENLKKSRGSQRGAAINQALQNQIEENQELLKTAKPPTKDEHKSFEDIIERLKKLKNQLKNASTGNVGDGAGGSGRGGGGHGKDVKRPLSATMSESLRDSDQQQACVCATHARTHTHAPTCVCVCVCVCMCVCV